MILHASYDVVLKGNLYLLSTVGNPECWALGHI